MNSLVKTTESLNRLADTLGKSSRLAEDARGLAFMFAQYTYNRCREKTYIYSVYTYAFILCRLSKITLNLTSINQPSMEITLHDDRVKS